MSDNFYTDSDKRIVAEYCKDFIKRNGYIRIGFGAENAVSGKQYDGDGHRKAFLNSISAILVNTGEYIREPNEIDGDFDIRINPGYKKETWSDRNPIKHDVLICFITFLLTLTAGLILWRIDNRLNKQEMEQIKDRLHKIETANPTAK